MFPGDLPRPLATGAQVSASGENVLRKLSALLGLALLGLPGFLPPARADSLPARDELVLNRGQLEGRLALDFFSGQNYFDARGEGRSAPGGFQFSEGKTTLGLGYGLTDSLSVLFSLPLIRREFTGYDLTEYFCGECYSEGTTTTYSFTSPDPYHLERTGIGDVTLETVYQPFRLPDYLPRLGARLGAKVAVGSNEIDYDEGLLNLGDGQHDLFLGLLGRGRFKFFLYQLSLRYRVRFPGRQHYTAEGLTLKFNYHPGDEFSLSYGAYFRLSQLTIGVSGNYIKIGKSRTWFEDIEDIVGSGFYHYLDPGVGIAPADNSFFSASVEIPLQGRNYPPAFPYLFHYRLSLNFQYRI